LVEHNRQRIKDGNMNWLVWLYFIVLLLSLNFNNVFAQSNDDCLMCHSDETLTTEKDGKEISLFVDVKVLAKSPHKNLSCVSCHV